MATIGQIIFITMIVLIVVFAALIILILSLAFSRSTSEVMSSDKAPIARLGEATLLSCFLRTNSEKTTISQMSVTWTKKDVEGFVYRYEDGAPDLEDQNSQFTGRTQVFQDALVAGNGSLLLRNVRRSDEGEYTCSISSAEGRGSVNIRLKAAAYSAPTIKLSENTLTAEATRWFPKPNATWLDSEGGKLQGQTNVVSNSDGLFTVTATLQGVNSSSSYMLRIENNLVFSVSQAIVTGSSVTDNTFFTFAAASSLLPMIYLSIMTIVLCSYYLT